MEIYLMRHGQTVNNVNARFTGQADVPMNEKGQTQIRQAAELLKGIAWDHVISSPLKRAKDTAGIVAPGYGIKEEAWLMEMDFGRWTGLTWDEAQAQDPKEWKAYCEDWMYSRAGGAECFMDVYHRVEAGIRRMVQECRNTDRILITAHAATVQIIPLVLLELPLEAYWRLIPAQGVYSKLVARPEEKLWFSLEAWNVGPERGWRL